MNSDYNFSYPIQIRWNDLDALGHVNNAIYVTYFEIARGMYMTSACKGWNWSKDMFLIGNINVNYHKEILLTSSTIEVHVRTSKIGTKSFVLDYLITSGTGDQIVAHASGTTTQIMFDMQSKSTIEIPSWVREGLTSMDPLLLK